MAAHEVGLHADGAFSPKNESDTDLLVDQLKRWQRGHSEELEDLDEQRKNWTELQTLLDGADLGELRRQVQADVEAAVAAGDAAESARRKAEVKAAAAQTAAHNSGLGLPIGLEAETVVRARSEDLASARENEQQLRQSAAELKGQMEERAQGLPTVSEAEEAVERANTELKRVESLSRVLDLTESFLKAAQDRAHRDIAPVLVRTLEKWLPHLTGNRYSRCTVDPESLEVRVAASTGDWRPADRLSVGTKEQVYLLLRVALAEHLASKQTVSPLLLDDVTVQADPTRTAAILRMCKALAQEGRQVILFAQESGVAEWADANLEADHDKLLRLEPLSVV